MSTEELKDYEERWFYGVELLPVRDQLELIVAWNQFIQSQQTHQ